MASLSELYNNLLKGNLGTTMFANRDLTLPNAGGTYSSPVISQVTPNSLYSLVANKIPNAPVNYTPPAPVRQAPPVAPVATAPTLPPAAPTAPTVTSSVPQNLDKSKIDPFFLDANGNPLPPDQAAQKLIERDRARSRGDIPTYAGNLFTQAMNMRNAANDIATGTTDPYKIASQSGVAYSPQELSAIEKAYAGIYDPALTSAISKLQEAQKAEQTKANQEFELKKLAKQHEYSMKEKLATGGGTTTGGGITTGGTYVQGENPVVDQWVERINRTGEDLNKAIPGVKNQELRNAVMMGLNATRYQNAKTSGNLDSLNTINQMLLNPELENISGPVGQFTGGFFGKAALAKQQYNQITGLLQLAKSGNVQGQGAISDYERKMLKEASSAIDRGLSDEDFRKALVKIRGVYATSSGLEAKVKITDPSTGESDVQNLTTNEIEDFIRQGAVIEYVE